MHEWARKFVRTKRGARVAVEDAPGCRDQRKEAAPIAEHHWRRPINEDLRGDTAVNAAGKPRALLRERRGPRGMGAHREDAALVREDEGALRRAGKEGASGRRARMRDGGVAVP
jgi:hypothetical protein